jgi:hypothetical protein
MTDDAVRSERAGKGDSDGYQSDSESDCDGYRFEDPTLDEGLLPLIEVWRGMKEGWWNQAGYETYWDYVQASEKKWARMGFSSIY